jgi:formylglycine-generating enzyme required for sulfatase activity
MDTTEITQKDFAAVMTRVYPLFQVPDHGRNDATAGEHPVYDVNWFEALLYCNARSKLDGYDTVYSYFQADMATGRCANLSVLEVNLAADGYRLPTEAQWEYACRGGTTGRFFWGDSDQVKATQYALFGADAPAANVKPVATLQPNAFGLYDMCGGLAEWCADWYALYTAGEQLDPQGLEYCPFGEKRVARGGSYLDTLAAVGAPSRVGVEQASRDQQTGFRAILPAR